MNMPTSRKIRLALTTIGFAGLIVALNAGPAIATTPAFTSTPLGRGTDQSNGTLPIKGGLDVVVAKNVVDPTASSGWHSHPGGVIVVVAEGQITTYRSVGNHCVVTDYTRGQAFIERPGEPLNAKNNGTTITTIYATFPSVAVGGPTRNDEPDPGTC
jgi:quercetin dioxygenase-like cupin family protein